MEQKKEDGRKQTETKRKEIGAKNRKETAPKERGVQQTKQEKEKKRPIQFLLLSLVKPAGRPRVFFWGVPRSSANAKGSFNQLFEVVTQCCNHTILFSNGTPLFLLLRS